MFGITTHHGCVLEVETNQELNVMDLESKYLVAAVNFNYHLSSLRKNSPMNPPRVLIIGPRDSGKSTLTKTLCNYAQKQDSPCYYVDLNPESPSISIPGTISTMLISNPIDPCGHLVSSYSTVVSGVGFPPLVYFYGHESLEKGYYNYMAQVSDLAESIDLKLQEDIKRKESIGGLIIDCPTANLNLIMQFIDIFKVSHVCCLCEELKKQLELQEMQAAIVSFPQIQTRERSQKYRKYLNIHKIREYFYGIPNRLVLSPQSITIPINILQLESIKIENNEDLDVSTKFMKESIKTEVPLNLNVCVHSILAITQNIEPVLGFVYVSEIQKQKITMLIPYPGRLPKQNLVFGSIKWMELF